MGIRNGKEKEKVTGLNGQDHPRKEKKKKKAKRKGKKGMSKGPGVAFQCIHTYMHTYTSYYFIQEFGYFRGFLLYCCHFPIVFLVFIWRSRLGSGDKAGGEEMGCKRWSLGLDFHLRC